MVGICVPLEITVVCKRVMWLSEPNAFSHHWTVILLELSSVTVIENINTSGFHVVVMRSTLRLFQNCNGDLKLFTDKCTYRSHAHVTRTCSPHRCCAIGRIENSGIQIVVLKRVGNLVPAGMRQLDIVQGSIIIRILKMWDLYSF
jgi:hypothetical protein